MQPSDKQSNDLIETGIANNQFIARVSIVFVFVIKPIPVESRDIGSVLLAMLDRHLTCILFDRLKFLNVTTPIQYDQRRSLSRFPVAEKTAPIRFDRLCVSSLLFSSRLSQSVTRERLRRRSPLISYWRVRI